MPHLRHKHNGVTANVTPKQAKQLGPEWEPTSAPKQPASEKPAPSPPAPKTEKK